MNSENRSAANADPVAGITKMLSVTVDRIFVRPDGSEFRVVATKRFGSQSLDDTPTSIAVFESRVDTDGRLPNWQLCSDRPPDGWREMSVDDYVRFGRSQQFLAVTPAEISRVSTEALLAAKAASQQEIAKEEALSDEDLSFMVALHQEGVGRGGWSLRRPSPALERLKARGLCQHSMSPLALSRCVLSHDDEQLTSLTATGMEAVVSAILASRDEQQPERQR